MGGRWQLYELQTELVQSRSSKKRRGILKFVKVCTLSISIFAVAAGLTASQANAQALKGKFSLPFQAHWGELVLQPGEYRISLPINPLPMSVIYLTGQGKTRMIVIGTSAAIPDAERSYLRIENVGQAHVIREFNSGGTRLTFLVSKSVKNEVAIARNEQDTTIPVAPTGGN
jgi:hypothetical protein